MFLIANTFAICFNKDYLLYLLTYLQRNAIVLFVGLRCVCYICNATQKKYAIPGYIDGNKCAKNCCKRTILVQPIIEDVVKFYFGPQCRPVYAAGVVKKGTVYHYCPFLRRPSSMHYCLLVSLWILLIFLFHKQGYLCTTLIKTSSKNFTFAADAMFHVITRRSNQWCDWSDVVLVA